MKCYLIAALLLVTQFADANALEPQDSVSPQEQLNALRDALLDLRNYADDAQDVTRSQELVPSPVATDEQLRAVGDAISELRTFKDNAFIYEEKSAEATKAARALEGHMVDVVVEVRRVTKLEVFVEIEEPGRTRLTLQHEALPEYGNLGTHEYYAQPSADDYRLFAKPVGVRIGYEIDEELAKKLRKYDQLVIRGRIDSMRVRIDHVFKPLVVAIVTDWKAMGLTESTLRRYEAERMRMR